MPTRRRRALVEAPRALEVPRARVRPVDVEIEADAREAEVGVHFVEILLVDMADAPVPGERYRIELPDGTVRQGVLDAEGRARIDGLKTGGTCKVTFPNLDQDAWEGIAG